MKTQAIHSIHDIFLFVLGCGLKTIILKCLNFDGVKVGVKSR